MMMSSQTAHARGSSSAAVIAYLTYGKWVIWRGFHQVEGDPAPAVATTKKIFRMYPLSQKDNPPKIYSNQSSGSACGLLTQATSQRLRGFHMVMIVRLGLCEQDRPCFECFSHTRQPALNPSEPYTQLTGADRGRGTAPRRPRAAPASASRGTASASRAARRPSGPASRPDAPSFHRTGAA